MPPVPHQSKAVCNNCLKSSRWLNELVAACAGKTGNHMCLYLFINLHYSQAALLWQFFAWALPQLTQVVINKIQEFQGLAVSSLKTNNESKI